MPDTTSKTGTGANFTDDGRPIDHSLVSLSEYQNARGQPQTDYEGLVYDAAGGSRIMTPQGERYFSPYAAQPTKEELSWLMSQPTTGGLTEWQKQRPGYVDPMDYKTYEDYAGAANIAVGRDEGNDLTNRANFYGLSIEDYNNVLSGDMTRPMGGNKAVYGAQLLSPLEQRAAQTARGQGIGTMSPETLALARANPDVFNAASQRFQNYLTTTYPGTLEYESVLSGPMQFSPTGVKYPEIKDTASMYILDPRTKQYVKNPNYRSPIRKADGGLMSLAGHMASKGRGPDSMLIHMSPSEVRGLQALAMKHGGSLTINPETGLPEAGFLDKLLPTIIGAGISYFSGGTIDPMTAAAMVGGVETARTGDLGRGISAGLGAYGGANLTAGMTTAGSTAMAGEAGALAGSEAAAFGAAQGFSPEAIDVLKRQAIDEGAMQQGMSELTGKTTTGELFSKGFDVAKKDPMAYLKANAKNLGYAFGPAILAGASAKENMPKTTTGMITPYTFDPYSGTYTAATPYRAAEGGLMGLAAGGMAGYGDGDDVSRRTNDGMAQGGMYDFAQRSEPVVRMAGGGVVALAAGGDYRSLTKDSSADDIASAYKQFTTASGGDTAANQKAAIDYLTNLGIGQDKIGQAYGTYQASPTYTDYTQQNVVDYLTTNKNANIAADTTKFNANPFLVNQAINQMASGYLEPSQTTAGSGAQKYYDAFTNAGIDANELFSANKTLNPNYAFDAQTGEAGLNALKRAFDVAKQFDTYEYEKAPGTQLEKDVAFLRQYDAGKFTGDRAQQIEDIARETGLSLNDAARRYDAARAAMKPVTPITPLPVAPTKPIIYNTAGTNTPAPIETVLGLPPGVSGAGITTVNPGGTITTRPNIPGIPEGGFTGMTDVRNAYEKGGGSLGYVPYTPKTIEEFDTKYGSKLTGGSKQSYDYLTGKTPYSPVPYTPTGEVMKPYSESVLGIPMASSKKMYLFDPATKTYKINPDFAIPTYDKDGKKSLNLTNQDVINYVKSPEYSNDDAFVSWMTANNLSPEQVAAATGMSIADVYKKIKKAKPVEKVVDTTSTNDSGGGGGEANGGLMSMARGGMAQQFNLGDYSDGGRLLRGPGDGVSDSIPASIGGKRPARLADGEFVVPARIVSELGNGSTEAGARKLYAMMDRVQSARRGTVGRGRVAKNSRSEKYLPA